MLLHIVCTKNEAHKLANALYEFTSGSVQKSALPGYAPFWIVTAAVRGENFIAMLEDEHNQHLRGEIPF